jgi:sterol desaturase/sphingolipid hydroxylase (fatty acid hydroxylase superfamily)
MSESSYQPADPALETPRPERRTARNFLDPMPAWLRLSSLTIRMAVLVVLLFMFIVGWGTFSIWVAYGGAIYLVLVTIAVPLWIAYMFWWAPRR